MPQSVPAGRELPLSVTVQPGSHASQVRCFSRRACQTEAFKTVEMRPKGGGEFEASIPASEVDPTWDLMIFFEVRLAGGEAYRYPDWSQETPYFLVVTGRNTANRPA